MAQRKPKFHIFALLVVVFLIILVLASFSFTIAFSARADNGKGLLQNPVYGSVPLVKEFRKIYWYGLIGGVLSCILHAFGWLAVIHWGLLVFLGLLEVVVLFLIGWTTVLIPKHASEALAICSSPREWPRRPDRLHDVFASLGMKSPDTMQLTAGCNSMMKQWRWSVAVLALNTFVFFLIFFIGYLWIPFINVTAFAWQWLRRNSHRPVQRSPKVSLPLEKRNPASGDASVKHQRFSFESIRSKLSQNLHYADVADSYRETTLSDIPSEHVPTLRLETCEPGSKTQCWSCGNQICKSCTVKAKTPMPESTQHLQHCLPYCSRCHFIFLCSRGEKDIENTGKGCNIPEHAANQSTSARAKNVVTEEVRSLCRACGQLKREETTKVYERRELVETRRMARNLQCHACSRELNWSKSMGKQPRCWWRCDSCSSTCWWNKHMGIDG